MHLIIILITVRVRIVLMLGFIFSLSLHFPTIIFPTGLILHCHRKCLHHSEMAKVHHVLPQRDNFVLCETSKLVNPDDASSPALKDAFIEQSGHSKMLYRLARRMGVAKGGVVAVRPGILSYQHPRASEGHGKSTHAFLCFASALRMIRRDLTVDLCIVPTYCRAPPASPVIQY